MTVAVLAAPYAQIVGASGTLYTADAAGFIVDVALNDLDSLRNAGAERVGIGGEAGVLIGRLLGANMNSTADQAIPLFIPAGMPYRPTKISVRNASISLTTAVGGVYTAASKGGTAIVANSQVYSALTTSTLNLNLTIVAAVVSLTVLPAGTLLYLSLTTAQGVAATADLFVYADLAA